MNDLVPTESEVVLPPAVGDRPATFSSDRTGTCSPSLDPPSLTIISSDSSVRRLLDNRLLVASLLLVVGPLGLPALWLNRRFSRLTKILGTIGFLLISIVFPIVMTWYWCQHALQPLVDALLRDK